MVMRYGFEVLGMCGGILGVFFGFLEGMYKISETEGPREAEVPINLCHPTFAMTGALAWQVTKS